MKNSPTTIISPWSETVSKDGASAETSHRYRPVLDKLTDFRTTTLSVELWICKYLHIVKWMGITMRKWALWERENQNVGQYYVVLNIMVHKMCGCRWGGGGEGGKEQWTRKQNKTKQNSIECKCDCGRGCKRVMCREDGNKDGRKITKASPLFYHSKR